MENEKVKLWLSIFVDTLLLLLWFLLTWLLNEITDIFHLDSKIDRIVLNVFVWGLGLSTIISTVIFLIKDTVKIIVQAWLDIQEEFRRINNEQEK